MGDQTSLGLYKPSKGEKDWGVKLNENFDKIDQLLVMLIALMEG